MEKGNRVGRFSVREEGKKEGGRVTSRQGREREGEGDEEGRTKKGRAREVGRSSRE